MQRLMVIDLPVLVGVDGLIGGETLANAKAVVDYRNRKLHIPGQSAGNSLEEIGKRTGMAVEKLERDGNYIFAQVRLGADSLRMLVDTGAQQTIIGSEEAARLKLSLEQATQRVVGAGDQARETKQSAVDELVVGTARLRHITCLVMPLDYLRTYSKSPVHGVLGADVLSASGALLSVADAVMILHPGEVDMTPAKNSRNP